MIIPDNQREAINDAIIDLLMTPKYIARSSDIMTEIILNHEWEFKRGPPLSADIPPAMNDMVFRPL